jgi:type VI protein secretion system component Hcp
MSSMAKSPRSDHVDFGRNGAWRDAIAAHDGSEFRWHVVFRSSLAISLISTPIHRVFRGGTNMVSIFVKIDGIRGTGTGAHQGWLKAESFSATQSRNGQLMRLRDAASQALFRMYSNSTQIQRMTIDAVRSGSTIWRAELSDVVISGLQVSAVPQPAESLALNFRGIETAVGVGLTAPSAPGNGPGGAWSLDLRRPA